MAASAEYNVFVIADMNQEQKVRNMCRQFHQEARLGRNFGYRSQPVRYHAYLPDGFSILKGGKGYRAWALLERDQKPVTKRFYPAYDAAEMYAEFMAQIDA